MTGAQLAVPPRLLYINVQTPETLSLKGTEEEFQPKVETTKTAASTKKTSRERKGRSQPTSELCGKKEWENETEIIRRFHPSNIHLRWLTAFSFEVDFRPITFATLNSTTQQSKRLRDNEKAKLPDDRDASVQASRLCFSSWVHLFLVRWVGFKIFIFLLASYHHLRHCVYVKDRHLCKWFRCSAYLVISWLFQSNVMHSGRTGLNWHLIFPQSVIWEKKRL